MEHESAGLRVVEDERWYEPCDGGCLYRTIALHGAGVDFTVHIAVYSAFSAATISMDEKPQWSAWITDSDGGHDIGPEASGECASWDDGWTKAHAALPALISAWANRAGDATADAVRSLSVGAGASMVPLGSPRIDQPFDDDGQAISQGVMP